MFYAFISMIGAGTFGYSLERKSMLNKIYGWIRV